MGLYKLEQLDGIYHSRGFARVGILGDTRVHEDEGDEANDEIPALVKELKKLGVVREEQDLTCDEDED